MPILGLAASARDAITSAAVWPCAAQCILFCTGLLQPLVVHGETLDQVLAKLGGGPLAELGAARRADPVSDRQSHIQVIVLEAAAHLPRALLTNL